MPAKANGSHSGQTPGAEAIRSITYGVTHQFLTTHQWGQVKSLVTEELGGNGSRHCAPDSWIRGYAHLVAAAPRISPDLNGSVPLPAAERRQRENLVVEFLRSQKPTPSAVLVGAYCLTRPWGVERPDHRRPARWQRFPAPWITPAVLAQRFSEVDQPPLYSGMALFDVELREGAHRVWAWDRSHARALVAALHPGSAPAVVRIVEDDRWDANVRVLDGETRIRHLDELATDADPVLRAAAASNVNTPIRLLDDLAEDKNPVVRAAVASHPYYPESRIRRFISLSGKPVRFAVEGSLDWREALHTLMDEEAPSWAPQGWIDLTRSVRLSAPSWSASTGGR